MSTFLQWGVRDSFVSYIEGTFDGSITAAGGAVMVAGEFRFPSSDGVGAPDTLRYLGDLRFSAHGGFLFVMIKNPWITFNGSEATLSVVDVGRWPDTEYRVSIATIALPNPTIHGSLICWEQCDIALTADGVALFGDQYPVGTPMAPLSFGTDRPEFGEGSAAGLGLIADRTIDRSSAALGFEEDFSART